MAAAFTLSAEHEHLMAEVRALARDVLAPLARTGQPGRVNRKLVRALGDHGLIARLVPPNRAHQGSASALELCLLREALARESTEAETALALQGLGADPIAAAGGDAVAGRWLPAVARTAPAEARTRGITAFAVPGDAPGLQGEQLDLLAPHAIGRLAFDGVRVGAEQVLGRAGEGFALAMRTLDRYRPSVGAETAQWVVDSAVQVHGARALVRGHLLEHLYREVRAPRIYEGTSEIQRTVIARELFRELRDRPDQPKDEQP